MTNAFSVLENAIDSKESCAVSMIDLALRMFIGRIPDFANAKRLTPKSAFLIEGALVIQDYCSLTIPLCSAWVTTSARSLVFRNAI